MRKLIPISLLMLLTSAFVMLAAQVNAQEQNPWVATFDTNGNPCDQFDPGEDVVIKAYSKDPLPYEIIVKDPDGNIRFSETSTSANYYKKVSGITDKAGWWKVKAGTTETHFACAWYQVIPEVPFGTMAILLSMFGALSVFAIKKKRNFFIGKPL